jgi:hypothetical protein
MKMLYHRNHQDDAWKIKDYAAGSRTQVPSSHEWGGGRTRRLLQAAYTIAFLCLLRFDEVLKIQAHDIEIVGKDCFKLTLPFRKTSQFGGGFVLLALSPPLSHWRLFIDIKPFVLYELPQEEAHLCPVRALAEWLAESKINQGYIFRKIASGDRVSETNRPMVQFSFFPVVSKQEHADLSPSFQTSELFLELFRNNLLDIGVDPHPYGTHSFRRGGCQYLASDRRWKIRQICEWGGWSVEFTNLTIVKYLISENDDPTMPRDDFFNPNRCPTIKCPTCGRSCACA